MHIIPYDVTRRDELFTLLRACLGEKETIRRDERFWGWKHERNPFGPSLLRLGEKDGQLVGLRAFLRWQWQAEGEIYPAVRAVDTATHPDYQRQGIFSRLTLAGLEAARQDGTAFVFNTPNASSLPGYLKMSWRHVACLPMQVRVLRPLRFAAGLVTARLARRRRITVDPGEKLFRVPPVAIEDCLAERQAVAALLAADLTLRGGGLTTARSPEFLRWRYAGHPYVAYHGETVQDGEQLRGLLIWRVNTRFGLREVMLCDLLLADDDPTVVKSLLDSLRRRVRADYLIAHFGHSSAHLRLLRRRGFLTIPGQGMEFTVRLFERPVSPDPLRADNWSLCLGDLEIF